MLSRRTGVPPTGIFAGHRHESKRLHHCPIMTQGRHFLAFAWEGAFGDFLTICRSVLLFTSVHGEVESEDAFLVGGLLEHFGVAQSTDSVVIPGTPVVLHAPA